MTLTRYTIGFVLSLLLTFIVYLLTVGVGGGFLMIIAISLLAVVQMIVQLVYFLHLGEEVAPRYRLLSFLYMAGSLVIIVVGSIWIMQNLDYNMMNMSADQKTQYMLKEHDKGF